MVYLSYSRKQLEQELAQNELALCVQMKPVFFKYIPIISIDGLCQISQLAAGFLRQVANKIVGLLNTCQGIDLSTAHCQPVGASR